MATRILREAIITAGELSGYDKKGRDGLIGLFKRVADENVEMYCFLVSKLLPKPSTGRDAEPVHVVHLTSEEILAELALHDVTITGTVLEMTEPVKAILHQSCRTWERAQNFANKLMAFWWL